jgi:hypothetical protein
MHTIKTRLNNFETLAQRFVKKKNTVRPTVAMKYGMNTKLVARAAGGWKSRKSDAAPAVQCKMARVCGEA